MANPMFWVGAFPLVLGGHRGVHPDHQSVQIDQRSARVARVDGGVGLDETGQVLGLSVVVLRGQRPVLGGDDPLGDRGSTGQGQRVADGQHRVAHPGL